MELVCPFITFCVYGRKNVLYFLIFKKGEAIVQYNITPELLCLHENPQKGKDQVCKTIK